MKIIIIGGGKVGQNLIEVLCSEDHDISLIDTDENHVTYLSTIYDILGIVGSGTDVHALKNAGVEQAQLVIATSDKDEFNILSCVMAKNLGAENCIARVRDPHFTDEIKFLRDSLGISMIVFPELYAAREISRTLRMPSAIKVEAFSKGRIDLAEIRVEPGSVLANTPLSNLPRLLKSRVLICAVSRGDEIYIPQGDFVLKAGDRIHVTASPMALDSFFKEIGTSTHRGAAKNVIIAGGGTLGYYLTKALLDAGMNVKVIESSRERCDVISAAFRKAIVINADASASDELLAEGLTEADAFVALTGNDEQNIVLSLYAKKLGVAKVITKLNNMSLSRMSEGVGIDSIISPSMLTCNMLIQYVRSSLNRTGSGISTFYRILGNKAEALEFVARDSSKTIGVPLVKLKIKPNSLIAGIIRGKQVIIPGGNDTIQIDDSVIVVTTNRFFKDLDDIIQQ